MKPINASTELKRLHCLIDRYFDAIATAEEERELMTALATTELSSEKIDEARAVISYFAVGRAKQRHARALSHRRQWMRAAATIAIVLVFGAAILFSRPAERYEDRCIAYIGSTEVTDNSAVLAMMHSDLAEISEVTTSLRTDANAEIAAISDILSL